MLLPRVKPEHLPYRMSGGRIRIGGLSYGIAAEVVDPTGAVWTLLECMDGTRDAEAIVGHVRDRHPEESAASVRDALELFCGSGYVEDAGAPAPAQLTERDLERYDRGRAYFRWVDLTPRASTWEPQVRLREARVTVVGLGGTGGCAAMALAGSGVGRLHCVDRDTVELSNLNRQIIYTEADIGRSKVEASVERLRALNSDITVTGLQLDITGTADLMPLAADCDVLLMAADRPQQARAWANRACLAAGTPWVQAGYHGPLIPICTFVPGHGGCWECLMAAHKDHDDRLGVVQEEIRTRRGLAIGNAVAAPSAGISGYLAAHAVLSLITDVPPARPGQVQRVNLAALDHPFVTDIVRRPDCAACRPA